MKKPWQCNFMVQPIYYYKQTCLGGKMCTAQKEKKSISNVKNICELSITPQSDEQWENVAQLVAFYNE